MEVDTVDNGVWLQMTIADKDVFLFTPDAAENIFSGNWVDLSSIIDYQVNKPTVSEPIPTNETEKQREDREEKEEITAAIIADKDRWVKDDLLNLRVNLQLNFNEQFLKDIEKVPIFGTADMIKYVDPSKETKYFSFIEGSNKKSFKDIKPGDFFVWRTSKGGHTGLVKKYDKEKDQVHIMEAIGSLGSAEEDLSTGLEGYGKNLVRNSIYTRTGGALFGHKGWKGYFRPKTKK